jgi:hypothetical protein
LGIRNGAVFGPITTTQCNKPYGFGPASTNGSGKILLQSAKSLCLTNLFIYLKINISVNSNTG